MNFLKKIAYEKKIHTKDDTESIVENVSNILNSVRGYNSFLNDFGISDYRYLSSEQDIYKTIIMEIKRNIISYEPRILVKEITFIKGNSFLSLSFTIDAVIKNNGNNLKLFLNCVKNSFKVTK